MIWRGENVSEDCINGSACPGYVWPTILDVSVAGPRIGVLVHLSQPLNEGQTAAPVLVLSEDGGSTWKQYDLPYPTLRQEDAVAGLVVTADQVYEITGERAERGTGTFYDTGVYRVNLDTLTFTHEWTTWLGNPTSDGSKLISYQKSGQDFFYAEHDVASGSVPWQSAPGPGLPCDGDFLRELDPFGGGYAWRSYCYTNGIAPDRLCLLTGKPNLSLLATAACVPRSGTPPEISTTGVRDHWAGNGWSGLIFERGGSTWGTRIVAKPDGSFINEDREIGPGKPRWHFFAGLLWFYRRPNQARFAGFLPVEQEDGPHNDFYRPQPDGSWKRFDVPRNACKPGAFCGYLPFLQPSLTWIIDRGGGDYLGFYSMDPIDRGAQNQLVVAPFHIDDGSATAEAGALEKVCAREQACFPDRVSLTDCINRWIELRAATSAQDTPYQRFVATTDCNGFRTSDPTVALPMTSGCSAGCSGNVGTGCDTGQVSSVVDCREWDSVCTYDSVAAIPRCTGGETGSLCSTGGAGGCDASGRAYNCSTGALLDCRARGLGCGFDPEFNYAFCSTAPAACTEAAQMICDGAIARNCRSAGLSVIAHDCGRMGLTCSAGACALPSGPDCLPNENPSCDGTKIVFCWQGVSRRSIDCSKLGFRTCGTPTGPPRCIP